MKLLIIPIILLAYLSGCATHHNMDTKSNYQYAIEATNRGDNEAGYRLLEGYFESANSLSKKNINDFNKSAAFLKAHPTLITVGKNTYTEKSFKETVERHRGSLPNAMAEETKRFTAFRRMHKLGIVSSNDYKFALSNLRTFFKDVQKLRNKKASDYMWSRKMRDSLYALSLQMDKSILSQETPCQGKARLDPISTATLQTLQFNENKKNPSKGVWTIRYKFDRCGTSSIYNAVFQASKKGPANVYPLPPGTTRASIRLMKDIKPSLFMATVIYNKGDKECRTLVVTNSKVTVEPKSIKVNNQSIAGVWEERWTVRTCTGVFNVDYCFIPKKSGGTTWTQTQCDPSKIATALSLNPRR